MRIIIRAFIASAVPGARMKSATFRLDRQVYELLMDERFQQFTIRSLRDGYANSVKGSVDDLTLWRYVYDQIRRLKRVGWIRQDQVQRKRDQLFHVLEIPRAITLVLIEPSIATSDPKRDLEQTMLEGDQSKPHFSPATRLQSLAKEIRLDMLTAMGEAERYKQLFTEMPALKAQIEEDYLEARDRSSKLLGHLRAVENTLRTIVAR